MIKEFRVTTSSSEEMLDITAKIQAIISKQHIKEGQVTIFIPHTTAAVTINENADPDVTKDMVLGLTKNNPKHHEFKHLEGNSHAHILSSLIGVDQTIVIQDGNLVLGTWQGIYFCEFDGPRKRRVIVQVVSLNKG